MACGTCGQTIEAGAGRAFCSHACYLASARKRSSESLVARFWAKVNRPAPDACWPWTASTIRGYGQWSLPRCGGKKPTVYAHRFAWTITHGDIPDNLSVCHRCDTPLCCNPKHLFLGTRADNLADARAKGRLVDGRHLIKVDDAGMLDIRTNYRPRENGKQLAAKYGITLIHLLRIVNGTARVQRPPVLEPVPFVQLPVRGEVA